jgi:exonuclease VII small subunit
MKKRGNIDFSYANLGDRIEKEFYARHCELNEAEIELAKWYFNEDFEKSFETASQYLEDAVQSLVQRDDEQAIEYLRNAGRMTSRARKTLSRARKICFGFGELEKMMSYNEIVGYLDRLADKIHLIWEFPDSFGEILDIYPALQQAVREGDYKTAAALKESLEYTIARNNPCE